MKTFDDLTDAQQDAIDWLYEHDATLLDGKMGGGKTICTLSAVKELFDEGMLKKVLVVAPLKVAKTVWQEEAADWEHTQHLKVTKCLGTTAQRLNALKEFSNIVVINFDNLIWLMELFKKDKALADSFDGLVIDELTKLKSAGSKQFKKLRPQLHRFSWRVGLTGTAVSENWESLYAMMLVLDSGKRLGTNKERYMQKYFYQTDYQGYKHELHPWAGAAIAKIISDVVYTMADYRHELPPPSYETVYFQMTDNLRAIYKELKGTNILQLEEVKPILDFCHTNFFKSFSDFGHTEIEAENAAVLSGKLRQIVNGFAYAGDSEAGDFCPVLLDTYRVEALEKCLNSVAGSAVIVYWYKADLELIQNLLPDAVELNSGAGVEENVKAWNAGKIKHLLLHPQSGGHGLNIAKGGHNVIWYTPTWSRDLYEQTNARLWRRGQTETVRIIELIASDSIDELIRERVADKAEFEALWKKHLESV